MATYTEAQRRTALETVLQTAAPNALIWPFWVLGHDPNEWPGLLKPAAGPDANKVHGYVFTRTLTEGERRNPQCVTRNLTYDFWGFYFYDPAGTKTANSDLVFNTELDAITNAFIVAATLPPELQRVEEEPSFRMDLDTFGSELLHYATGRVVIVQL